MSTESLEEEATKNQNSAQNQNKSAAFDMSKVFSVLDSNTETSRTVEEDLAIKVGGGLQMEIGSPL